MVIREKCGEIFVITITRDQKNVIELWIKKKHKKNASAVASHLRTWSCKLNGEKCLTSFTTEDQKLLLENKWNVNDLLAPEETDAQAITDMGIKWLIDCDNMLLVMPE